MDITFRGNASRMTGKSRWERVSRIKVIEPAHLTKARITGQRDAGIRCSRHFQATHAAQKRRARYIWKRSRPAFASLGYALAHALLDKRASGRGNGFPPTPFSLYRCRVVSLSGICIMRTRSALYAVYSLRLPLNQTCTCSCGLHANNANGRNDFYRGFYQSAAIPSKQRTYLRFASQHTLGLNLLALNKGAWIFLSFFSFLKNFSFGKEETRGWNDRGEFLRSPSPQWRNVGHE